MLNPPQIACNTQEAAAKAPFFLLIRKDVKEKVPPSHFCHRHDIVCQMSSDLASIPIASEYTLKIYTKTTLTSFLASQSLNGRSIRI